MTDFNGRWYRGTWEPGHDISHEQTAFATKLRIPFLTSLYPSRDYKFGIVVNGGSEYGPWRWEVPSDEEVALIADVRNAYMDYMFPEPNAFRAEMEAFAPYDIENGHPCHYFIKQADGSWRYRRNQWRYGPEFMPAGNEAPLTLAEVIDYANERSGLPGWVKSH